MKTILLVLLFPLCAVVSHAQPDTLVINYQTRIPFSYTEESKLKGIDVDIMNEYLLWLNTKKKISITFKYNEFTDFASFYQATSKGAKNTIGLGSVPITPEFQKEVDFTSAYLKHVAFCVTNGNSPDIKVKERDEIMRTLGYMTALTVTNTALSKYVAELKKQYISDVKVIFHPDEVRILDEISRNVMYFGYVDAVGFWHYLKTHPGKFLKMQKVMSLAKEEFGFIMPKNSTQKALFNEFFNGPSGFKSSPQYRAILERHLGTYMASNVAIN